VLQFDAHTDLRTRISGRRTTTRASDGGSSTRGASRPGGIRSMSEEEDRFLKKSEEVKTFYASEVRTTWPT